MQNTIVLFVLTILGGLSYWIAVECIDKSVTKKQPIYKAIAVLCLSLGTIFTSSVWILFLLVSGYIK